MPRGMGSSPHGRKVHARATVCAAYYIDACTTYSRQLHTALLVVTPGYIFDEGACPARSKSEHATISQKIPNFQKSNMIFQSKAFCIVKGY
jgi:hypothetical protein